MVFSFYLPGRVCFDLVGWNVPKRQRIHRAKNALSVLEPFTPIIGWIVAAGRFWPTFAPLKRGGAAWPNMT
ncbi:MAG: hypothetical protein DMF31_00820 [Verrucomicrobia bacterium]|nr:MAG: hypothetical protein DMF31_00820 [Verrucomicrobiota bacterium]